MRHPLTVRERPEAGPVEAVIFDWGGTLTPWHTIDLGQQWRVFAREVHGIPIESDEVPQADLDRAQELAERIHAVEAHAWRQVRDEQRGAHLDDILAEAGIDPREDRHHVALDEPCHGRQRARPERVAGGADLVAALAQRVDHPDIAAANAQAITDLEGGADALVLARIIVGRVARRGTVDLRRCRQHRQHRHRPDVAHPRTAHRHRRRHRQAGPRPGGGGGSVSK